MGGADPRSSPAQALAAQGRAGDSGAALREHQHAGKRVCRKSCSIGRFPGQERHARRAQVRRRPPPTLSAPRTGPPLPREAGSRACLPSCAHDWCARARTLRRSVCPRRLPLRCRGCWREAARASTLIRTCTATEWRARVTDRKGGANPRSMYVLSRTSALVCTPCTTPSLCTAAVIKSARERIRGSRRDPRWARPPAPTGGKVEGASRPTAHAQTSKSQLQRVRQLTRLRCAREVDSG